MYDPHGAGSCLYVQPDIKVVKINYLSQEGFDKLKTELRELTISGRKEIAIQIAEARSHGDLSENAEYEAAKEAQSHLEKRIAELENILANSRVIDERNLDNDKVYLLSKVTILNKSMKKEMIYTIVSAQEADFKENKISSDSPIGAALMGKAKGDVVKVKVPAGMLELEILNIER
jgi:transcription elongation factor GreA